MTERELLALVAAILLAGKYNDCPEDAIFDADQLLYMAKAHLEKKATARRHELGVA